jgi:hypothetical protein
MLERDLTYQVNILLKLRQPIAHINGLLQISKWRIHLWPCDEYIRDWYAGEQKESPLDSGRLAQQQSKRSARGMMRGQRWWWDGRKSK